LNQLELFIDVAAGVNQGINDEQHTSRLDDDIFSPY